MDNKSELDGNALLDEGHGYSLAKTISFGSMLSVLSQELFSL